MLILNIIAAFCIILTLVLLNIIIYRLANRLQKCRDELAQYKMRERLQNFPPEEAILNGMKYMGLGVLPNLNTHPFRKGGIVPSPDKIPNAWDPMQEAPIVPKVAQKPQQYINDIT